MPVTPAGAPVNTAPVAAPPIVYTIGVIAVPLHTVCAAVAATDVKVIVGNGFTVIVPVKFTVPQPPPLVVTVYVNGPVAVGEPVIVNTDPTSVPVTPAGAPVKTAPVAPPPIVYTIDVIAVPLHTVCVVVAAADVKTIVGNGFTVIEPVKFTVPHAPPLVVTV